jgi:hypothetical protein
MGSEHFGDGSKSDRILGSSSIHSVGYVLAPRFFSVGLAQDFCAELAGFAAGSASNGCYRRGGVFMLLKMFVLSGSAIVLWLAPLVALDKKVGWHKSIQGLSLCGAVACAIGAGDIARKLVEENEVEEIRTKAINADVVDEIAVSAYISQQQRQQEAEAILNPVEHLERALALTYDEGERSEPIAQKQLAEPEQNASENAEAERAERVLQLKAKGWGKAKIILEIWGASKGGSRKYKDAEGEYDQIIGGES